MTIEQLVLNIAKVLCDDQDQIVVEVFKNETTNVIRLRVSPRDVGKIVGKQGRTARSLRMIISGASRKHGRLYQLEIMQTDRQTDL